ERSPPGRRRLASGAEEGKQTADSSKLFGLALTSPRIHLVRLQSERSFDRTPRAGSSCTPVSASTLTKFSQTSVSDCHNRDVDNNCQPAGRQRHRCAVTMGHDAAKKISYWHRADEGKYEHA